MADNQNWQELAIRDLEETDLSYKEIGELYGRDRDTIIKLKKRFNLTRKLPPRKGPKKMIDRRVISPSHRALGIRITIFRADRSYTEMAAEFGISPSALRNMELGLQEVPLSTLLRMSEVMGRNIHELIQPYTVAGSPESVRKTT